MDVKLIKIGNSKGIRLPKSILDQCNIAEKLKLEIEDGKILLIPIRKAREGWSDAFARMHNESNNKLKFTISK